MREVQGIDTPPVVTLVTYDIITAGDEGISRPVYKLVGIDLFLFESDAL
ncbi:hypothetical protein OLX08_07500 [Nereida ignava]